jgi:hypothetical protein
MKPTQYSTVKKAQQLARLVGSGAKWLKLCDQTCHKRFSVYPLECAVLRHLNYAAQQNRDRRLSADICRRLINCLNCSFQLPTRHLCARSRFVSSLNRPVHAQRLYRTPAIRNRTTGGQTWAGLHYVASSFGFKVWHARFDELSPPSSAPAGDFRRR